MADILVRAARQRDAAAIRALIRAVRINPFGLSWRRFLVAMGADGALLGCGQIRIHADGSRELASVAVAEKARGRGVAQALIQALLKGEHQRPLYLMCRARLEPLYARFGFRPASPAEMPPYFRRISRIESLFNSRAPRDKRLLVMQLD